VGQNLDLETDELDFFRVGEVSIRLMNNAVIYSPLDRLQGLVLIEGGPQNNLVDKLGLQDE